MYSSGSQNQLHKSSSQTLKRGFESIGIGEEKDQIQSKQVQNLGTISDRYEQPEQENGSYRSNENIDNDVSKNMKNSQVDQDYRINTNNQSEQKNIETQQSDRKYDSKHQVTNQFNSQMSNGTRRQSNDHNILNELDDQKNKIKNVKIDSKIPDCNKVRQSIDESLYMNNDMRIEIGDSELRNHISRSNPRSKDKLHENLVLQARQQSNPDKSDRDQNIIDDEMTERIRRQGEMMIKQPEIIENQPHKQLEKAMKDQISHREKEQEYVKKNVLIFPESNYSSIENTLKEKPIRGDSLERKDDSGLYDFLDGSFGRKKRENMINQDEANGRDNRFRNFKIEKPSYMIEKQGTYEQIRNSNYEDLKQKAMTSLDSVQYKFGMAGPSGRHTKIGSKGISAIGIGSGLGVNTDMKIQENYKYDSYRGVHMSKSIPREIFPSQTSSIDSGLGALLKADRTDNILHGRESNPRRTVSSSPFGRETYESKYGGQKLDSQIRNRNKSPMDDIYKKYNIVQKQEPGNEDIDDQFKQCQDLLEKAKQRRLLLSGQTPSSPALNFKDKKYDGINDRQTEQNPLGSRNSLVLKEAQEPTDVPDVKTLHQRYENLMNTIQEHTNDGSVTNHSHTTSNDDLKAQKNHISQAKTMKWKKGEKSDQSQVHEYKQQRPLRVPKPSVQNTTNLSTTYDYLMNKHDDNSLLTEQTSINCNFNEVNNHHIASFGRAYHDRSHDALPGMGDDYKNMRPKSLGKTNFRTQIHEYDNSTSQVDKKDFSQISNGGKSQISLERSFYKPHSPEMKSIEKVKYTRPFVQRVSQERNSKNNQNNVNSIERPIVSNQYLETYGGYQVNITPINQSQPSVSKKFQIERKNYDDFAKTSQFDKFENSYQSNVLMNSQQTQQTSVSQPSVSQQSVVGQIGKIVRQSGPKINMNQNSNESNKQDDKKDLTVSPPKSQISHYNTQDFRQNQYQSKDLSQYFNDQIKNVDQQINPVNDIGGSYLSGIQDVYKKQGITSQVDITKSSKGLTINTNQVIKDTQLIQTPTNIKSNIVSQSTISTVNQVKSLFPKLEQIQTTLQEASKDQPEIFNKISYSKYQSSFQINQFNPEFVCELVNQMQDITDMFSQVKLQNQQSIPLNLDFDSIETQQSCQKLKTQYDISKDPKTWVIQLYDDMCNARSLATQHETDIQQLRDHNLDLQKQNSDMIYKLETLKVGMTVQTPILTPQIQSIDNTQLDDMKKMYEEKIKMQTQTELEWMERIDALITCQKFYKQKEATSPLPMTCFDPETSNPKQIFSNLLNKLEVLLCQSELDKSKNKKLMSTTVKEMDKRITSITNKFQKIQKQIIETCSFADDDRSNKTPRSSITGENEDSKSEMKEGPSVRSTIEMLKRIRRDRDEQEKIIDQLKQIIQIQDRMKKSDFDKMNVDIKNNLIKNIEHFVNEEHKKEPRKMKLAWVTEMSDISASCNDLMDNSTIVNNQVENLSQAPLQVTNLFKSQEDQTVNQTELEIISSKINVNDFEKRSFITSGVQTDFVQGEKKLQQVIKIFKEVNLQTDDVIIQEIQEQQVAKVYKEINIQTDDIILEVKDQIDDEVEMRSSTTTERRQKQLNTLSADLKQNMNQMLNEQLSKHLQQNMNEIATIKQENGRLIEKYKFEQKQVHKLKDDLKKKQKYEQFFEKQRAKKFRNCGCQVGQPQLKYAYNDADQNSQSYYHKAQETSINKSVSNNSQTVKSGIPSMKYRNKENHSKTKVDKLDDIDASKITLKKQNNSKSPSFDLKSQDQYNSIEDHQSLNTQALAYKYGVSEENSKIIQHFKNASSVAMNQNDESKISKTISNVQSPSIHMNGSFQESKLNGQERQLLDYHMKKNEELHHLLMTYLGKNQLGSQNSNILSPVMQVSQLTTLSKDVNNGINEQNTVQKNSNLETLQSKENHDPEASNLASSANFGQRVEHQKESKHVDGERDQQMNINDFAVIENSDKTEGTKKCNYIDQYFSYKNHQKKDIQQTPSSSQPKELNMEIHQSFGNINAMHAAILNNNTSLLSPNQLNNESSISAGFKAFIEKEVIKKAEDVVEMDQEKQFNYKSQSNTATRVRKDPDDENDNNSDIVNVSEQIKQIEGRQMIHCDLLDNQNQKV